MNTQHHTDTQEIPTIQPRDHRRRVKAWHILALAGLLVGGTGVTLGLMSGAERGEEVSLASSSGAPHIAPSPAAPTPDVSPSAPAAVEPPAPEAPEPDAPEPPEPEPEPADETDPIINWVSVPSEPIYEQNWSCQPTTLEVQANMSDNVGLDNPRVVYFLPGTGIVAVPMELTEAGHHSAVVGPFPAGTVADGESERVVTLGIVADDAAGNYAEEFAFIVVTNDSCLSFG